MDGNRVGTDEQVAIANDIVEVLHSNFSGPWDFRFLDGYCLFTHVTDMVEQQDLDVIRERRATEPFVHLAWQDRESGKLYWHPHFPDLEKPRRPRVVIQTQLLKAGEEKPLPPGPDRHCATNCACRFIDQQHRS